MGQMLDKVKEWLANPENVAEWEADLRKQALREEMHLNQLQRFAKKIKSKADLEYYVEKVVSYYDTKKYKDMWYRRRIVPPMKLYTFLYDYAEFYGRRLTKKEIMDKDWYDFTMNIYYIHGYYFRLIQGQGSAILIYKE